VSGSKTCFNNPEVDLSQHTERLKAIVYVISIEGRTLMPCTPAKAKKLLNGNRAKVIKLYPFTIKLNFECENQAQEIRLGVDSGFNNVGMSAITSTKEVLSQTITLDSKTSSRLTERRMYRRLKRNKLWYRKSRFLNRGNQKEGWLPPSIQRRYDAHLTLIKNAKSILPISKVTIETGNFDIAKIINPDINGIGYQQGDLYGYQNMRAYLMAREHGLCQLCHKEFTKGNPSHIHHCKERHEQGSDRSENLAIIHKKCHKKLHNNGLKLFTPKEYKANTFMSIIQHKFKQDIPDVNITFGYKTFVERQKLGLEKSHATDAFVIAGGATQERYGSITIQQKHRNNRAIQLNRKGFSPSIRKQRYAIQPKDLIWINGKIFSVGGMQDKGTRVKIEDSKKVYSIKSVEKMYHFGGFFLQLKKMKQKKIMPYTSQLNLTGFTGKSHNKRWKQDEIDFIQHNINKPVDWLSSQLNRSEGSINTMIWKLKKESETQTTVALPHASSAGQRFDIKNNSDKPIKIISSSPIVLEPNESTTISGSTPHWQNQVEKARQILVVEGMAESQADTEMSYVYSIFHENPTLKNCHQDSIVSAIIDIGRTKSTINPALKLAYLKAKDGKCVFELTYRGLIKSLTDSGSIKVMDAHIVYEDDYEFEYLPAENKITHKPKVAKTEAENNARQIAGAYSVAILNDGTKHYHFMEIWKLAKIEQMSTGGESDYFYTEWKTDMYKKCAIRSHYKFLPKGTTLPEYIQRAIMIDDENSSIMMSSSKFGAGKKRGGMMEFFNNPKID
jgi:phage RecT family recombinase